MKISQAKPGDIAHFKCGGSAEIIETAPSQARGKKYLYFGFLKNSYGGPEESWGFSTTKDGIFVVSVNLENKPLPACPFNIVKVTRPTKKGKAK